MRPRSCRPGRHGAWVAAAAVALVLAACAEGDRGAPSSPSAQQSEERLTTAPPGGPAATTQYMPGLAADVYPAQGDGDGAPVVVLVPGGSWLSAQRQPLAPLAAHLAAEGSTVVSLTYGTGSDGVFYPRPVAQVACGAAFAVAQRPSGATAGPVVLVGHSAGAVLVALAALDPPDPDPGCEHQPVTPDAVVGLAGPYDVTAFPAIARWFFGTSPGEDPQAWQAGSPLSHAGQRPEVPVLLLHGTLDRVVPVQASEDFAQALQDGGHEVRVETLADADHLDVYRVPFAGDLLADWVDDLT